MGPETSSPGGRDARNRQYPSNHLPFLHSEDDLQAELDVARIADFSVPHAKRRARNVRVKDGKTGPSVTLASSGGETVPVPDIEELGPKLEVDSFTDPGVFQQRQIMVVVTKSANVGHARPLPPVEIKRVLRFKGIRIKEWLLRVEIALVLGKRISPGNNSRDALGPELSRDVALVGPEKHLEAFPNSRTL